MTTITTHTAGLSRDRLFYTGMTLAMALTAFAGFAPSFYLRSATYPGPPLTAFVIFHGVLMTAWVLAGVVQTSLIASRNVPLHRTLGWMFAALALAIVLTGPEVGIAAIRRGAVPPPLTPEQFLVLPFAAAVMFGAFVTLGVLLRTNAQAHKRLMLLATIAMLDAAIARMPGMLEAGPIAFFALADLFIVPGIVFDLATRGRVHAVWLYGGLAMVASQALRLMLSSTEAWASVVRYLVG